MFYFWINFIIARNFKIFFIFQSYDESVLVLWKKVTILTKLSSLIILRRKRRFSSQNTTFREWQTEYFFNTDMDR